MRRLLKNAIFPMIGGIRRKSSFVIATTAAITLLISISITYIIGSLAVKESVGREQFEISKTLSLTAAENIRGEVDDAQTYATRILWKEACEKANHKYAGMDRGQIEKKLLDTDMAWMAAGDDDKLITDLTSGSIPESMREIIRIRGTISEIFITDKFGGLIYSSGRTSDFYQADEDWWQKCFNGGRGMAYLGPMEHDSSSDIWGSVIAIPVKSAGEEVIGICKVFVQIDKLFDFINKFKMGTTGHAFLADDTGTMLFHKGVTPLTQKVMPNEDFVRLKNTAAGYIYVSLNDARDRKSVVSFCPISSDILLANGIRWNVMTSQDSSEALKVLNTFLMILSYVAVFLIPMVIPIGLFLGGTLSRPIDKLSDIAKNIAAGKLDQNIDIRTGDEIELFAEAFRVMTGNLEDNQKKLISAKDELEELSRNQDETIKNRTKDLTEAQEATLNILEDLTETKNRLEKYSKDLEKALQIKSDFTSTVSHELRTPLAAIKEGIAIVLDGTAGDISSSQKEFLDIAKRNVDRLARLINDLLDFQKLEAGKMAFNIIQNDMNETVRDAAKAMNPVVEKKQLKLILELDDKLPNINFDKDKILQVLANLINNAIKYTEKGSIKIKTGMDANTIKVSVIDTGAGMKNEDIPKLFTQFTQLENISDRKTGSTGLGLSICKDIIKAHSGKIWAESDYGKGSTFAFVLPIVDRRGANG